MTERGAKRSGMRPGRESIPRSDLTLVIVTLWLATTLVIKPAFAQPVEKPEEKPRTRLVLLGTGTPNARPDRMGPATAIVVGENAYIFDTGTGVVRRAEAARAAQAGGMEALRAANLKIAFLTHLHSDHTLGLADISLTPWVLGRSKPLQLYGPAGTEAMAQGITEAYAADIKIRIEGSQPHSATGWRIEAHEFTGGTVYSDEYVGVESFRVCHGEISESFGYRITTPDKVIVISGDTGYCPIIAEMARGVDILVHEAYSEAGFVTLPPDWQAYHSAHHTSASDVARIAKAAKPALLVLTHQLSWGDVPHEKILDEVKASYSGAVAYGHDLDIFE